MPTSANELEAIDARLSVLLDRRAMPQELREAMRYAVLGPGKRVRPALVLRWAELAGGRAHDEALTAASALEMVHAFSLVHDDLPAMDDDDLRRGRATLHKFTNEAMAILAGDALLAYAHEVIAKNVADARLSRDLLGELASATTEMINGQVLDTFPELPGAKLPGGDGSPLDRLCRIHLAKTGALLRCACRMGVRCAGGDAAMLEAAGRYADAVGLMFQAVDDLLDVTSDAQTLGKATQKDADAGKLTFPGVLGLDETRRRISLLLKEALDALVPFGPSAQPLRDFAQQLASRDK